jgi:hypothetical protein
MAIHQKSKTNFKTYVTIKVSKSLVKYAWPLNSLKKTVVTRLRVIALLLNTHSLKPWDIVLKNYTTRLPVIHAYLHYKRDLVKEYSYSLS